MQSAFVVFETVLTVIAVMAIGGLLRRRGVIGDEASAALGRIVADVAFPALCFEGLARADAEALSAGALVPVLGFSMLALSAGVAMIVARVAAVPAGARPTFVFLVAIGNWIFLPLPLAEAIYGEEGTRTVVLNNAGAQLFLWTAGIAILRGRRDAEALRSLAASPGLWATVAGVAVSLARPHMPVLSGPVEAPLEVATGVVSGAIHFLATLTVPLVTLAIGAQLAAPSSGATSRDTRRAIAAVVVGRLLVAPLVFSAALELALRMQVLSLPPAMRVTEHLISAMPVSLSAAALVQRHGGDTAISSRAILITTLLSALSVPLIVAALSAPLPSAAM
jgi:predicted permease